MEFGCLVGRRRLVMHTTFEPDLLSANAYHQIYYHTRLSLNQSNELRQTCTDAEKEMGGYKTSKERTVHMKRIPSGNKPHS